MKKIVRERSYDDVCMTVESIAEEYGKLSGQYTCIIHCMQPRPLSFYKQFGDIPSNRVLKAGDAARGLKKWFSILVLGYPAYILVKDATQISKIFGIISQQSMGGIYIFKIKDFENFVTELSTVSPATFLKRIHATESHVCYLIDEDSGGSTGNITEIIEVGENCPPRFVAVLGV